MRHGGMLFAGLALLAAAERAAAGDEPRLIYEPGEATAQSGAGETDLPIGPQHLVVARYPYPYLFSTSRPHVTLTWGYEQLRLAYGDGMEADAPRQVDYASLDRIGVVRHYGFRGVTLGGDWYLWCRVADSDVRDACVRAIANALFVHRAAVLFRRASDERFAATLVQYSDRAARPAFPEEARRHKVQAEAAVQDRRIDDAIRSYVSAVRVAPWWPEGYFNLALLNGESGRPEEAVRMMKRFLALEPGHPQARAAQDRIYVWEEQASRGTR